MTFLLCLTAAPAVCATDWASSLFETRRHDFGTVARAAKAEYEFVIRNRYNTPLELSHVRTSCGCTTPSIKQKTIPVGGTGAVVARFNTRSFTGRRAATITVVFRRPYYAEVQLYVSGYIRRDIVFNPGVLDFGSVAEGQALQRVIDIQYAGRSDWQITQVRSPDPHIQVQLRQTRRDWSRVGYQLVADLDAATPPGYLNTELTLWTNDASMRTIPLSVVGSVTPLLTVSPSLLYLGQIPAGGSGEKRIVVRAAEPFAITGIDCDDSRFQLDADEQARAMHFLTVTFNADQTTGDVSQKIQIHTDLRGGKTCELTVTATVAGE